MNREEDFSRLEEAIRHFPVRSPIHLPSALPPQPKCAVSPREAVLAPSEWVPTEQAAGRIAAQAACPCPPGVPVVMPGNGLQKIP